MKNFFTKYLVILFFAIATSSCGAFYEPIPEGWSKSKARPFVGTKGFPPATNDYGIGFRDGCGMAWDAVTKGLTSDIYPKTINAEKVAKSPDYATGWFDGFEQCTYIVDWDVV